MPVGGVTAESMAEWRRAGAAGFGIGGSIYRPGDAPAVVRERAEAFAGPGEPPPDQWRNTRTPVNAMAMPASSAAAITSASRIEPPGWITAVAPASAAWIRPSAKGKKASEAQAEPVQVETEVGGAHGGDAGGILAVHLSRADAEGLTARGEDDGVRLDVLGDGEGEQHVRDLRLRRLAAGDDLQVGGRDARGIAGLGQEAAGDGAEGGARSPAGRAGRR